MSRTAVVALAIFGALHFSIPAEASGSSPLPGLSSPSFQDPVPSIADAPKLKILDSPVIREWSDLYEPVKFMHSKHANVIGDCSICHHRVPREKGDTYGEPVNMEGLREKKAAPVSCSSCHARPFNSKQLQTPGLKGAYHQLCMDCHQESEQVPYARGPVVNSAMVRGPVARTLDTRAPTDCLACHAKKVVDHTDLVKLDGPVDGPAVTRNCLSCHAREGEAVLKTAHWNWQGPSPYTIGHEKRVDLGKRSSTVNNFCINLNGNWPRCTSCHIGYGWKDAAFDFKDASKIDCLVCHDTTQTYKKAASGAGFPADNVDLLKVAKQVGRPSRSTCGMNCHFQRDGGYAGKDGDLSAVMKTPSRDHDVHMGVGDRGLNFNCQDCHKTRNHMISGRSVSVATSEGDLSCEYCHTDKPHIGADMVDFHLNRHTSHVACQTCHIPVYSKDKPTRVYWDWSTAGKDLPESRDKYGMPTFNKQEGSLGWAKAAKPAYAWYNGTVKRYLLGDRINDKGETVLARPIGSLEDPAGRIYPFKISRAKQISDSLYKYLIAPRLWEGFWKSWDWSKASEEGMRQAGLPYSGRHEFVETVMYRGLTHEVVPKEKALSCAQCHTALTKTPYCGQCHQEKKGSGIDFNRLANLGRDAQAEPTDYIDFKSLGYKGDPIETGGRFGKLLFGKRESTRVNEN
ncbi:MAG: tetrathionate reductase family octaheme c-type cytochrome [Desulfobacteraceae bacterium]|nr:MAG: tetrathionate reductase family octaheme c-type cytochrome [Desulfobacteraceae bacterium]